MIKVGILGATGYAGAEIARILISHPDAETVFYGSRTYAGQRFSEVFPYFRGLIDEKYNVLREPSLDVMAEECDVIFTATPQGYLSSCLSKEILSKTKVIDLSADYRLKDIEVYKKWYPGIDRDDDPSLLSEAVYGLCEINREEIKKARLIANPGCFTTCSILTAYPLVAEGLIDEDTLIVDAKSGTSGAGRSAKVQNLFCEVNESVKPYGVTTHRHTPEIEEQLGYAKRNAGGDGDPILINFTPHLIPMHRGILATEYASLKALPDGTYPDETMIRAAYEKYYGTERFIRLLPKGSWPETRFTARSEFTDIGFTIDERTKRVVMAGALDNLVKGAAGQAVQNMNIIFALPEEEGLLQVAAF
ncbi:MAG: N-acetyl-gamma-glutamyl-phosphate reductase [Lachnospiraceae bacterium]|nr:N-acetyl-gamma-glutamyl-phosphate reductase [Lachnospiraceae bacterium]